MNIDTIDTYENPKGIIAVSSEPKTTVLAYPDKTKGYVRVKSYDKSMTALINAHESEIANLALNPEGTIVATASDKGTLIRIYNAEDGTYLHEVRRGTKNSEIYSICFNQKSTFLACSSDRGTIHIFSTSTVLQKLTNPESDGKKEKEKQKEIVEVKNPKSL
jgi:WD40 repeat protein